MYYRFLILVALVQLQLYKLSAQKIPSERPKLIVGIIIDQMRYDYIFRFWDKYENNGIKRLINEGSFCKNANFNYIFTQSNPGFATISTGTNPSAHGIIADEWYVELSDKMIHCTLDEDAICVGSDNGSEKHSPSKLLASTIGDEIKLASYRKSKVISVSLDASAAILSAGHLADGAYWFDNYTGRFVTSSSYCKELPKWVKEFNDKKFADTYLGEKWTTLLPDSTYTESLPDNNKYETGIKNQITFPYDLNSLSTKPDGKREYMLIRYTPMGNNITKDFAISALVNENLGKDEFTDYLIINFSATEYISRVFGISSMEMEDAYLRLDKEIKHFLDFLDNYIGKGNIVVYLTSNHGAVYNPKLMMDMGVPAGNFNQGQAIALLKSYLNVLYGNGDWIKHYSDQQIFLNRTLVQDSKIDLENFQSEIGRFLIQFSGVTNVATSTMLQKTNYTSGIFQKMQNSFHQKRSGDILFSLEPGWTEITGLASSHNSSYNYDTHVPLIFYGWKINRQTIYDPVDMIDIAPTISMFLDIAYPNASQGKPIIQLFK
jgi:predicted AlkP superfamily pyrophosphatase or phosphodiesterase